MKRFVWELRFWFASELFLWAQRVLPRGFDTEEAYARALLGVTQALGDADYWRSTGTRDPRTRRTP